MLIKDLKFYVLEGPPRARGVESRASIEKVPPGLSGLFTHSPGFQGLRPEGFVEYRDERPKPTYSSVLRLVLEGGMSASLPFGSGFHREDVEWEARGFKAVIGPLLIGVDAFDREYLWQRLWYAQRFFYTGRRAVELIDTLLWDFASRFFRLPIYRLLGGYREKIPAYRNISGDTIEQLVADAVRAKDQGYKGCKDHSYRGVKGNIGLARELRAAVGDDFLLLHDPVESYTYDEAVKVGRALEELDYVWMEEPLQDYDIMGLKKLCDTLDLPILAMEWVGSVGGQPYNASGFLALGATDIVRQRGVGITGQMKLAHLAEGFGVDVHGGNPHVILAIKNDPLFEAVPSKIPPPQEGERMTPLGRTVLEHGYMSIAWGLHPPEEPDWDEIQKKALAVI